MPDAQNSEWQSAYKSALRESDLTRLAELVALAESATFLRLQKLGDSPVDQQERQAMQGAADNLLPIKTEKLKFPPTREGNDSPTSASSCRLPSTGESPELATSLG